ncbi:choice-of-anchor G family protein [Corynebacterium callunae]|uniref:choice-of-anchor G family protein n=1 Tax=Corynebacterium callunae TaxID=1721 RepID=UPI003981E444
MKPKFPSLSFFSHNEVKMFRAKVSRIIALVLSMVLIAGAISPAPAKAQTASPYDPIKNYLQDAYSYGYGGLLDLRLLAGYLKVGQNGRALTVAELNGANQQWQTLVNEGQAAKTSTLDLQLLESIYLNLGSIQLPLVGNGGLLQFVLSDASLGVAREFAHAPSANKAIGSVGVVSDSGALGLTQPGAGANATIDLLSLLSLSNGNITQGIIDEASISLGAVSSAAEKPNWGAGETCTTGYTQFDNQNFPASDTLVGTEMASLADEENGKLCSKYQIADAKVVIDAPLVGGLVTTLQSTLNGLLEGVETTLNSTLGAGGLLEFLEEIPLLGTVLSLLGTVNATVDVPTASITSALVSAPLSDSTGLVSINLGTGEISIDVEKLHAGNLNNLAPNTSLLTAGEISEITDTITNLLTASKEEEPNGLNARLDKVLRGENKRGGLYGTKVDLTLCALTCTSLTEVTIKTTLGGLLNPNIQKASTEAIYLAAPYDYYFSKGSILGLTGPLIVQLLGDVGTLIEGLLFGTGTNPGGLLGGVLGNLQTVVVEPLLDTLDPVLDGVLAPLANLVVNRQFLTKVAHGNVFTVSALEVNVVDLNTPSSDVVHLPLATSSVMAQHWVQQKLTFNVAKTGDGRNLHSGGYSYNLSCKVDNLTILEKINANKISYPSGNVGTNFTYNSNSLALVGATTSTEINIEAQLPVGAVCEVSTNPSLTTEEYAGLRPTGDTATRTPYTYFLDTDSNGLYVSDVLNNAQYPINTWATLTNLGGLSTTAVGDKWKQHSLKFAIRGDSGTRADITVDTDPQKINIVHAYEIDTRDIVVTKEVVNGGPTGPYEFEYSTDGTNWKTATIDNGQSFTIENVPLIAINEATVTNTSIQIREKAAAPANGGPVVSWAIASPATALTNTNDGTYSTAGDFLANLGLTVDSATTPAIQLKVTNTFPDPVNVDFEAMLPETGRTTLVWVLGLGVLAAIGAVILFVRSRRQ